MVQTALWKPSPRAPFEHSHVGNILTTDFSKEQRNRVSRFVRAAYASDHNETNVKCGSACSRAHIHVWVTLSSYSFRSYTLSPSQPWRNYKFHMPLMERASKLKRNRKLYFAIYFLKKTVTFYIVVLVLYSLLVVWKLLRWVKPMHFVFHKATYHTCSLYRVTKCTNSGKTKYLFCPSYTNNADEV